MPFALKDLTFDLTLAVNTLFWRKCQSIKRIEDGKLFVGVAEGLEVVVMWLNLNNFHKNREIYKFFSCVRKQSSEKNSQLFSWLLKDFLFQFSFDFL